MPLPSIRARTGWSFECWRPNNGSILTRLLARGTADLLGCMPVSSSSLTILISHSSLTLLVLTFLFSRVLDGVSNFSRTGLLFQAYRSFTLPYTTPSIPERNFFSIPPLTLEMSTV